MIENIKKNAERQIWIFYCVVCYLKYKNTKFLSSFDFMFNLKAQMRKAGTNLDDWVQ